MIHLFTFKAQKSIIVDSVEGYLTILNVKRKFNSDDYVNVIFIHILEAKFAGIFFAFFGLSLYAKKMTPFLFLFKFN